jgi:hypothetical protein
MPSRPPNQGSRRDSSRIDTKSASLLLPELTLVFLVVGAVVRFTAGPAKADAVWMIGLVVTGVPVVWRTLRRFATGHFATDFVAALAVTTSVILLQPLAGLVIVLMQTGGEALERYAEGRASAAVRALEEEAPRIAHRFLRGEEPLVGGATDEIGVALNHLERVGSWRQYHSGQGHRTLDGHMVGSADICGTAGRGDRERCEHEAGNEQRLVSGHLSILLARINDTKEMTERRSVCPASSVVAAGGAMRRGKRL